MRHLPRFFTAALVVGLLAGCFGADATPAQATSAAPTPTAADGGESPDPGTPVATADPVASDLGPFSCDPPLHEDATAAPPVNIVDVRVGTHDGYDRVVFEFDDGLPEVSLDRAQPPFTEDASGRPIEVQGQTFLQLIMRGGTKQTEDGTSSYEGPTEFAPDFPNLVHLVEGGDFEAQSTWYFGLSFEACVRVLTLTDDGPPRLVIDIEH